MSDFVEYKHKGVWQHFLREKGGTKLRNRLHDKTRTLCFLRVTCVREGTCMLAEDYFRRLPSRSSGSTLELNACYIGLACLLTIELTLTLITFGLIR